MKLSEFKTTLIKNFPNWEVKIDYEIARFILKDKWSEENKISSNDIEYIRKWFNLNNIIIENNVYEWECNNFRIESVIKINHNFQFEKEEWE